MELGWFRELSLSILQHLISQVWESLVSAGVAIWNLKLGDIIVLSATTTKLVI